jgi:hypothetical protein
MSGLGGLRRLVAIRFRWVVGLLGVAAIIASPFVAFGTSVSSGATLLMVGLVAVAISIQMARGLDIQRRVRKLAVAPAAAPVPAKAPVRERPAPPKPVTIPPPGASVTPGDLLSGHGAQLLPVIAFDLTGMAEPDLHSAVESIAAHQLITGSFKPVFLIDRPEFGPMRTYGYLAELLIAPDEWRGDPSSRSAYVRRRLDSILQAYACAELVRVSGDGLSEVGKAAIDKAASAWRKKHEVAPALSAPSAAAVRPPRISTPDAASTL